MHAKKKRIQRTERAHTTVHIRRSLLEKLNSDVAELHLRRDMLLNSSLWTALHELKSIRPAPVGASRADSILRRNNPSMTKLGLVLDSTLAESLTKNCAEKNVSRDAFIERTIEILVGDTQLVEGSPLGSASDILADPIGWVLNNEGKKGSSNLFSNLNEPTIANRSHK